MNTSNSIIRLRAALSLTPTSVLLLSATVASILTACGGESAAPTSAQEFASLINSDATSSERLRALAASDGAALITATTVITNDQLFDYAQLTYPDLFPGSPASFSDLLYDGRVYSGRSYSNGSYLAVSSGQVWGLGAFTNNRVENYGEVQSYMSAVCAKVGCSSLTVPGAPAIGAATPGNASASISFSGPSSNGGSAVTGYTATCIAGASSKTGTSSSSPVLVTGLTNGTAYTCTVAATNAIGTGNSSASVTVTPNAALASCAQAAHFPDVSLISNYIDWNDDNVTPPIMPSTAVSCANGVVSVVSNGIPNFDALNNGRGGADAAYFTNQKTWVFPSSPAKAATTTRVLDVLGPIGVLVNGVQFYSPIDAERTDAGATASNYCGGHTERFHSHASPRCFFNKITEGGTRTFLPDRTPGTVVGYAFDGYPVLSPFVACTDTASDCINGVREIDSAYEYRGTNLQTDIASTVNVWVAGHRGSPLDACNGMTKDGIYAYYVTKSYPYFLGCYAGTATPNR